MLLGPAVHCSGINALKASHNADQRRLVFSLDLVSVL